jgi:hypothetical protein
MNNYDDIFDDNFEQGYFNSPEERKEAKKLFNYLMNLMKKELSEEDIIEKTLKNLGKNYTKDENKSGLMTTSEVNNLIEKYNLELDTIEIEKKNFTYYVTENWISKNGIHSMFEKYELTADVLNTKPEKTKEMIIKKFIDQVYTEPGKIINSEIVNTISQKSKVSMYRYLTKKCVDEEKYEQASIYHNIETDLKS